MDRVCQVVTNLEFHTRLVVRFLQVSISDFVLFT